MTRNVEIGLGDEPQGGFVQVDRYGEPAVRADIRSLPFRHLDRIYASHVLEHLPDADIVSALKSCRRALRPGGVFEAYTPDLPWLMRRFLRAGSPGERWANWLRWIYGSQEHEGQYHRTGFSVGRLSECLIAGGFRQVKVKRVRRKEHPLLLEVHALAVA